VTEVRAAGALDLPGDGGGGGQPHTSGSPIATTSMQAARAIPPLLQLRMIREHPCVDVVAIATDRSPFFSATDELVEALDWFAALAWASPALREVVSVRAAKCSATRQSR
jgi:hypothetical protein